MRTVIRPLVLAMLVLAVTGHAATGRDARSSVIKRSSSINLQRAGDDAVREVPFGVGEKFDFEARFGSVKVGSSALEVVGIETVRDRQAWHTSFTVTGGTFFYRVNDAYDSWFDTQNLWSMLFIRHIEEGTRERTKNFEIFAERGVYIERTRQKTGTFKTVDEPLDEGAFLYFVRTIPLKVGETYDINRYFIADRNPVRLKVVRKETITVPAGTFSAIVIQPVFKTPGIFSEKGHAEVWLSDDPARMLLQVKSRLSFGSLNLYLRSYTPATGQPKADRD